MDFKPFKIGKYLLLERLAMGGMAEVYRAKASGAGGFEKQLAIKRILPNYSQNDEFRRMFEYEARLSSMLTHSNIVQIYDFVKSSDTYLLAMEYVDGKNLRQFINKIKKVGYTLPVEYSIYIVSEVCKGLEYAHKKRDDLTNRPLNIIHRDMSPQNVMLSYEGSVKIVDFGIAKAKDRVDETRSGVIKGKFGYMSPEQANGEPVDHRTDIFSTSIILYELLTSKRLFAAENDMATLKLIQECIIPPASRANPKVSPELEKIVMKGLTKDIALRYQSAGDMHRHLQEFLNKNYGSFTQKELADAMTRVFKEEISTEKKRFEQIYRQSIPFSQGAKLDDNEEEQEESQSKASGFRDDRSPSLQSEDKEEVTRSEAVEKTGETNFGESSDIMPSEIPYDVGSSGISKGNPSRTRPTNQTDSQILDNSVTNGSAVGDASDETMPATRAQKKQASEQNEKTVIEDSNSMFTNPGEGSSGTPTEGNTSSRAPTSESKSRFKKSTLPNSGVSLEQREDDSAPKVRRERSISVLNKVNGSNATDQPSYTESDSQSDFQPQSRSDLSRVSVSQPVTTQRRGIAATQNDDQYYPPPDEDEHKTSALTLIRTLVTAILLVVILIGTFKVWQIYLAGGLPNIMNSVIHKYSENPIASTAPGGNKAIIDKSNPNQEPNRRVANGCAINIDSDPRGSDIYVNGKVEGETPNTVLLDCGHDFNVTFKHDGFEEVSENVVMNAPNKKLYRTLRKIPLGNLELTINPGVTVEISDSGFSEYVNAGTSVSIPLNSSTRHKVHFRNEVLGIDVTREFKVIEGSVTKETINLIPGDGRKPSGQLKE